MFTLLYNNKQSYFLIVFLFTAYESKKPPNNLSLKYHLLKQQSLSSFTRIQSKFLWTVCIFESKSRNTATRVRMWSRGGDEQRSGASSRLVPPWTNLLAGLMILPKHSCWNLITWSPGLAWRWWRLCSSLSVSSHRAAWTSLPGSRCLLWAVERERAGEQFMIMAAAAAMKEEKKKPNAGVCPSGEKQGEHGMESEPTSWDCSCW